MPRTLPNLPIQVRRGLRKLGEDVRLARLRRRLPMELLAERAQISTSTLHRVERGAPGVSLGIYATVLWALGLGDRIGELADGASDTVGRGLEEERLPQRVHMPKSRPTHQGGERDTAAKE